MCSMGGCSFGLSSVGGFRVVEAIPCFTVHMWPLSVVMEWQRCVVMSFSVRPGIVMSSLLCLSACRSVAAGGDPSA